MTERWERQPEETTPAFAAFAAYRDYEGETGEARSMSKVARELSKSRSLLARWSGKYAWVERAAAWDAEVDRRRAAGALEVA